MRWVRDDLAHPNVRFVYYEMYRCASYRGGRTARPSFDFNPFGLHNLYVRCSRHEDVAVYPIRMWASRTVVQVGCNQSTGIVTIPIRGEVLYKGQPLATGLVVYLPTGDGRGKRAEKSKPMASLF